MGNAIVNESKIEKDFKQIYPNNKDVKIRIEFWRDSLPLIIRGWQTRRLTIIESINERDSFFLTNAEYYTDNSVIHMYLTKNSQTQRYGISNIYITTNGNDETILLTEENSKDYKTIAKKIDKIYFNIKEFSLLIVIDNDFISKQEKKLLEEVKASIKDYESKIERKKSRAEKLEEYKKAMENGVKPVYVESQEFVKPVNPIFILLESKLYFEELKKVLLSDYKSLEKNPVSLVQDNWHCFMLKSNSGYIRSDESKVVFHEALSDDYYSELLLELNKLEDFNIERTAQSLSIIQNDQFPSRKYVEQFDYGVLKDIVSFKVDKFEKVLQLLNFPKEIEVVLGRVQYVLNEDTKEYELQFLNLKDELQVKGDLFENNNIKKQWSNKIYSKNH